MDSTTPSASLGTDALLPGMSRRGPFVEITLLLPADRAAALLDLSRRRRRTVAQILRTLVDRALAEGD